MANAEFSSNITLDMVNQLRRQLLQPLLEGGETGQLMAKMSDANGDFAWSSVVYTGGDSSDVVAIP